MMLLSLKNRHKVRRTDSNVAAVIAQFLNKLQQALNTMCRMSFAILYRQILQRQRFLTSVTLLKKVSINYFACEYKHFLALHNSLICIILRLHRRVKPEKQIFSLSIHRRVKKFYANL